MPEQLFITASRTQLRIATSKGQLTVEDLWSLSLKDLDAIAVSLDSQVGARKSFLENPDTRAGKAESQAKLALDIIKFVIDAKQTENKLAVAARDRKARQEFLENLLERKKMAELESLSTADIQAQIDALG